MITPKGLGNELSILGIDDPVAGWAKQYNFKNFKEKGEMLSKDRFNILLSHRPGILDVASRYKTDLILAGHTHGGQVILPTLSLLCCRIHLKGLYQKKRQLFMLVKE